MTGLGAIVTLLSFTGSVILFFYWIWRAALLIFGKEAHIGEVLKDDLWLGRRIVTNLRALFTPNSLVTY